MALTDLGLRGWKWSGKDEWKSDGGHRNHGRLVAKRSSSAITFYFQYFNSERVKRFLNVGTYDTTGRRGIALASARDEANRLSDLYREGKTDLHAHFAAVEADARRQQAQRDESERQAAADVLQEAERAKTSTLRQLMTAYIEYLRDVKKSNSSKDVESVLRVHLYAEAPELADRRASDIPVDDFVELIGRCVNKGHGRTASQLRTYLRAAYSLAIRTKVDPTAPVAMKVFGIQTNPIASIAAMSQFKVARTRALNAEEMGAFLRRLDKVKIETRRDVVKLCIAFGGQRPTQLLRLTPENIDLSEGNILIHDKKGRRQQARQHFLPLTKEAATILRRRLAKRKDDGPLFPAERTKRGETTPALDRGAASETVREIATAMVKSGEAKAHFQLSDLRRTAETMLAALGISKDVRAQLQSHGLSSVQDKHYDMHKYMLEKRAALAKWERHLDKLKSGKKAKVLKPDFEKKAAVSKGGRGAKVLKPDFRKKTAAK